MPIKWNFTTPVAPPPADGLYVAQAANVNDTTKQITLDIAVTTGLDEHPRSFSMVIGNGEADALVRNPDPTFQDVLLLEHRTTEDNPAIATAFDQVMGGYFQTGSTAGILSALAALDLIPPGAIA